MALYESEQPALTETDFVSQLMEYTEPRYNPFKADWEKIITECFQFKEGAQWSDVDKTELAKYGVPNITADRIGRSIDTINGVRANTGNQQKVVKRETGDERIAKVFDEAFRFVEYNTNAQLIYDDAFDNLLATGMGLTVAGWDANLNGGEGDFFFENVEPEDCGWSYTKKKDFSDLRTIWRHMTMDWKDAIALNPDKAKEIEALKTSLAKKWEEIKGDATGTILREYNSTMKEGTYVYPLQVHIYEIWTKQTIPYKKVQFVPSTISTPMGEVSNEMGLSQIKKTSIDYQLADGEQSVASATEDIWFQHLIACGKDKKGGVLLTPIGGRESEFPFHPFVPMIAEFKKNGMPTGFIEKVKPHQIRINLALTQKLAYNNKSIKSPVIVKGGDPALNDHKLKQTDFGLIWYLGEGEELVQVNLQPNINLQAIEEGQSARQDMDLAAAATEGVMRGEAESGASGVRLAKQQDAAITPLNKWVKAESMYKQVLGRKVLAMMIKKYSPKRLMRIIGESRFVELLIGERDPLTGQPLQPPLTFPAAPDASEYDMIVVEKSVSDFKKQQSFNAMMALQGISPMGMFDDEGLIKNAPLDNVDDLLESNKKHRGDIIQKLMMQIQMLQAMLKAQPKDGEPNRSKSQPANASRGKNQPQSGMNMMIGGMSPQSPLGRNI